MQSCQQYLNVNPEGVTKTLLKRQVEGYFAAYADTVVATVGELQVAQDLREEDAVSLRKRLLPKALLMRTNRGYPDTEPDGLGTFTKRISVHRASLSKSRRQRNDSKALALYKVNLDAKKAANACSEAEQSTIKDVLSHAVKLAEVVEVAEVAEVKDDAASFELALSVQRPPEQPLPKPMVDSNMLTPLNGLNSTCNLGLTPDDGQSAELHPGDLLVKRYEILSEIERGGFGIVYRAKQLGIDRVVAIKRMRSTGNVEMSKRFLLEANIIKNLIHPNTIQLIDAGTDENGRLYIVMEYIHGASLRRVLDRGQCMGYARAVSIAVQVLKSINEAHQRGIIHRDLKPSNILLREVIGEKDFVKVLDFGVAKVNHGQGVKLTQNGKILGSPQYISPEICMGKQAGAYSDIYALGLIFVQMVAGYSVVPGDAMQAIQCHLSETPHCLPVWLDRSPFGPILRKALAKDYRERYQDARAMMDDLQKAVQNLETAFPMQALGDAPNNKVSLKALPLKPRAVAFIRSEKHLRIGMIVLLCLVNIILIYILIVGLNGKILGIV